MVIGRAAIASAPFEHFTTELPIALARWIAE
jgi:hypothetical protein